MKQMVENRENISSMFDGINVDCSEKNAPSFIMGQIVAMETGVTSIVSLQIFRNWTWSFICDLYTCVQIWSQIRQELANLERSLNQGQI